MGTITSPEVVTFGCRLNASEADDILAAAIAADAGDAVVVNTCAVTGEAERQARQAIRRLRRERPERRILVTGCAAEVQPEAYAAMAEVDRVIANAEKARAQSYLRPGGRLRCGSGRTRTVRAQPRRPRVYLRVQNGCDHRCTFCVIPMGRGPARSVPVAEVAARARALVAEGAAEIVLTGVDVTAWGADLGQGERLGRLVRRLLAEVPELARLRLSSLDPAEVDDELWEVIAGDERLLPHLHLSLQSGDDLILKRMKRRHSRRDAVAFCERVRRLRPDVALGADLIAGFPTESDTAFANTLALVDDCGLSHLHVFPYSPRPETPAARMPQVLVDVRRERAARLRARGNIALAARLAAQVGMRSRAMVEESRHGVAFARSDDYAPVAIHRDAPAGAVLPVVFTAAEPGRLIARVAA
ncbi:MAG: tRNA (N(6)-L-threonylcarbamoyladenosine(37)-C(2))-methylthiotransferase MtaB [Proteobacteria bacterium]|nr:tRNA (N(6)-L-threonylcarbamoyladenosine(37)-C(2))-methylthiotransferase MtaB [Pseudomonadota bacterium]